MPALTARSASSSSRIISIRGADRIFFIDLTLTDAAGHVLSRNFYWVPGTLTTFDWERTDYTHTPAARHEDLTALTTLPPAIVHSSAEIEATPHGREVRRASRQQLRGAGLSGPRRCAHFIRGLIAPVFWSDNWIELTPGESTTLTALLPEGESGTPAIRIEGWNITPATITPKATVASR